MGEADHKADSRVFIEFLLQAIYDTLVEVESTEQVRVQVSEQVQRLLDALENDTLTTKELMDRLGLKHRPTFRKTYLLPSMKLGLVEMTIPDKPNSSRQKYRKQAVI